MPACNRSDLLVLFEDYADRGVITKKRFLPMGTASGFYPLCTVTSLHDAWKMRGYTGLIKRDKHYVETFLARAAAEERRYDLRILRKDCILQYVHFRYVGAEPLLTEILLAEAEDRFRRFAHGAKEGTKKKQEGIPTAPSVRTRQDYRRRF